MKQYYLKISSKNEKSLKNFLIFLLKHLKIKFSIVQKPVLKRNYKKAITLLKSPHVNKTAQEHFESRIFSKKILLNSFYINKNFILLKKKLIRLFQDVSINIEITTNARMDNKNCKLVFYLDSSKFSKKNLHKENTKRNKQKIILSDASAVKTSLIKLVGFLNTASIFGELLVNNKNI